MKYSEKLKELEKIADGFREEWQELNGQYISLQTKIRKKSSLNSEIKDMEKRLRKLRRVVRQRNKQEYEKNGELQRLKRLRKEKWREVDVAWDDFHKQFELEMKGLE